MGAYPYGLVTDMPDAAGPPFSDGVCVLGMHRSGTSLLAGLLARMGADFGPDSLHLEPGPDNPRGFWEHREIHEINEEILARAGGSWFEPPHLPTGFESTEELADLRERARVLLDRDLRGSRVWGMKDPRMCLTLPFWRSLAPGMRYVITIRAPLEVARSLEARDGFHLSRGGDLWIRYTVAALEHTQGEERVMVFYDDALTSWKEELPRIAAFLELDDPTRDAETMKHIRAVVEPGLRHHESSLDELSEEAWLSTSTRSLYLVLRLLERADVSQDEIDRLAARTLRMHEHEILRIRRLEEYEAELQRQGEHIEALERQLETLLQTKTFRYTARLRDLYSRLRTRPRRSR